MSCGVLRNNFKNKMRKWALRRLVKSHRLGHNMCLSQEGQGHSLESLRVWLLLGPGEAICSLKPC
jgi:hypothetical protein